MCKKTCCCCRFAAAVPVDVVAVGLAGAVAVAVVGSFAAVYQRNFGRGHHK